LCGYTYSLKNQSRILRLIEAAGPGFEPGLCVPEHTNLQSTHPLFPWDMRLVAPGCAKVFFNSWKGDPVGLIVGGSADPNTRRRDIDVPDPAKMLVGRILDARWLTQSSHTFFEFSSLRKRD